jgi:NAD(P)-dependent dehydrogenase (short-subunit alcohol dehydrogenase family)
MSKHENHPDLQGRAGASVPEDRPRVLITGACRGVGRACAEALARCGTELILCDNDAKGLREAAQALGAVGRFCDVASEASVAVFAADIIEQYPTLDMVINAAGGGYERTLGMYRVSRALIPALRRGTHNNLLLNIPPADKDAETAIFPYASSEQAFHRLSAALAAETRGTAISVLIGDPKSRRVSQVLPSPDAGLSAETCDFRRFHGEPEGALASQVASLIDGTPKPTPIERRRKAS